MKLKAYRILYPVVFLLCITAVAFAQSVTQISPGLAGEKDARGRNPELYVTRVHNEGSISLQVDAHVPHPDYQRYPIQFNFYVNRQLFTSQIRTEELPGAIGVDIGPDIATPPFNYAVIAKVLHPHRSTHSMVVGAVYSTELSVALACTITTPSATYTIADSNTAQIGNDQFNVDILAEDSNGEEVSVVGTVSLSGTDATATLQLTENNATGTVATTGTISLDSNTLAGLNLSDSGGSLSIACE